MRTQDVQDSLSDCLIQFKCILFSELKSNGKTQHDCRRLKISNRLDDLLNAVEDIEVNDLDDVG
jgi:hypothetical protein